MTTPQVPVVREIAQTCPGDWRLHWLGPVGDPTYPKIEARFKKLVPGDKPHTVTGGIRSCSVSVGQLPVLLIGSLWRDGRMTDTAAPGERQSTLGFDASQARWVRFGDIELPRGGYPMITPDRQGDWFLAIPAGGDPRAYVVPAAEVVRFYYAPSTMLALATFLGHFLGDIERSSVINPERSFVADDGRHVGICLRPTYFNTEAPHIARILFSAPARRGAALIFQSLQRGALHRRSSHLKTELPFTGRTTWTCNSVRFGTGTRRRHLILSISSCTALFPFDRLTVARDNSGKPTEPDPALGDAGRKPAWLMPLRKDAAVDKQLQSQEKARREMRSHRIPIGNEQFPGLAKIAVALSYPEFNRYRAALRGSKPLDAALLNQLATTPGNSSRFSVPPARATLEPPKAKREALGPSHELILGIVDALSAIEGFAASVRDLGAYRQIPLDPRLSSRQWAYLDRQQGLLRNVMAADIQHRNAWYLALDVDARPGEGKCLLLVFSEDGALLAAERVAQIVVELRDRRWIARTDALAEGARVRRFPHQSANPTRFAQRIADHIRQV
jgi:hypothetical protein